VSVINSVLKFHVLLAICYRNGKSLGEAFSCVRLGPGYAYFPAVSLSLGESLRANFGATPLKYPFILLYENEKILLSSTFHYLP
jgi:hypothetical protein